VGLAAEPQGRNGLRSAVPLALRILASCVALYVALSSLLLLLDLLFLFYI
jgi:hypothetical protein